MTACFSIIGEKAKRPKEQTRVALRERRNYSRSNVLILNKFRDLYPVKTSVYLSEVTGFPVRTCEYWMSKDTLPAEAIWALLQSEHGLELLTAAMHDARPSWWKRLLKVGLIASVMRRREADLRLLQKTLDADRDLTSAIANSTALCLHDEEFHRPFLDAVGAMAGVQNSAVAEPSKRGGRQ